MLRVLPPLFKPVNNLIYCKAGFMWVVKRVTSPFNSFCSNVAKQVARFLLPVFAYLYYRNNEQQTTTIGKAWSRGTWCLLLAVASKCCSIQMQTLEFVYCTVICLTCEETRLPSYLVSLYKLMFVHKCPIHFSDHYILCDFNYLFCFVCDSLSMTTGLQPLWRRFRLSFMMTLGIRKELLI